MRTIQAIANQIEPSGRTRDDVFNFIVAFFTEITTGPLLEEIAEGVAVMQGRKQVFGKSTIHAHVKELIKTGHILRYEGRIIVLGSEWKYRGTADTGIRTTKAPT